MTPRQEEILKIIVNEYTKTAQPVSSKSIMELMEQKVSSATIRSECVFLESQNYLEKEHTSSGRIPSSKGYRYYVDHLMNAIDLDSNLFSSIDQLFENRNYSIDQIIQKSTEIISELTNLVALVSKKEDLNHLKIKQIQLIPLNDNLASVIFILNSGEVVNKVLPITSNEANDLKIAIQIFNDNLVDVDILELAEKIDNVEDNARDLVKKYESIFRQFISAIFEQLNVKTETFGVQNMLANPEFSDVDKLRKVLDVISKVSPFDWFDFNYQGSKKNLRITTKIGMEIDPKIQEYDDFAIIGAEIDTNRFQRNVITLIGPKRMRYDEANILLQFLIDKINGYKD